MKFSKEEKKHAKFILKYRDINLLDRNDSKKPEDGEDLKPFKHILVDYIKDPKAHEKIVQLLKYINKQEFILSLENWPIPVFPITGDSFTNKKFTKRTGLHSNSGRSKISMEN